MCGCRKGVNKSKVSTMSVRSTSGGIAAGPTPNQLRSQAIVPRSQANVAALSAERRKTQNLRRDAIRRSLNK